MSIFKFYSDTICDYLLSKVCGMNRLLFTVIRGIFFPIFLLFVTACGSNAISYQPTLMSYSEALNVVEELTMTQHSEWKPDEFGITDKYVFWNYGFVTNSSSSAAIIADTAIVGKSQAETKLNNERIYFRTIKGVKLLDWQRKFKQWYVVSLVDTEDRITKHALRTRSLDDAKRFMDAMESIIRERKDSQ